MRICPTCHQPISDPRAPKRVCVLCGAPIGLRHKWRFGTRGPEHRDCENPGLAAVEVAEKDKQGKLLEAR
jgi:hypothetical protein